MRREVSSREVVEAHVERLRTVAPRINAVAAERFDEALREADRADQRVQSDAEDLPPLLGVPFTVKESIALAGMPQSAGLVARRDYRSSVSAPAVQRLIDAGAIPLGVTNTSELTLWIESENRIYGRTSNPYDARRTAGGSSGGEGAAVGSGGSPFGVGSDIGGSVRIPAFFCGVFAHKPSPGLVPNDGMYPDTPGEAVRMLQVGPLARRAEDLLPVLGIMAGSPAAVGDPDGVALEGLQVTVVEDATRLPMSRELRDARERAVGSLAAAGARLRRVSLRTWRRAAMLYLATLQAEAGQTTAELLEAADAALPTWRTLARRRSHHTLATRITLAAEMLPALGAKQLERVLAGARELASELRDAIGDGVLLHPAHPRTAPRHGRTIGRVWLVTPAAVFNLAGVPVTEVPLGLGSSGLPVGVQVAAAPNRDEVSLAVALELERVFGGWVPPERSLTTTGTRFQGPRR